MSAIIHLDYTTIYKVLRNLMDQSTGSFCEFIKPY